MTTGTTTSLKPNLYEDDFQQALEVKRRARKSFVYFFNTIFAVSCHYVEGGFKRGDWLDEYCGRLEGKLKTSTRAARKHGKTTVLMAFVAWLIFKADAKAQQVQEYLYIMYSEDLAGEKIKRIKQYISASIDFLHVVDLKPTADTIIEYEVNGKLISVKPSGVYTFKRGKHPDGVICDDILRDPQKALDLIQVNKITQVFEAEITSLVKEEGFLHVAGTSQDESDLFNVLKTRDGWDCKDYPAILDAKKKIVLWKEAFTYERLRDIEKNETGTKNFQKEYQLLPVRSAEGFVDRARLEELTDKDLTNYGIITKGEKDPAFGRVVAGADLGKKLHPTHLSIFEVVDHNGVEYLIQIASVFMDQKDYTDQLALMQEAISRFGIDYLYFDNTRAEFESFKESGELPGEMIPIVFGSKNKMTMATDFDRLLTQKRIFFLDDDRQRKSILAVDNNLAAAESPEGHGDAFFSSCLAVQAYMAGSSRIL